jgi:hypothetical protein
VLTGSTVTFIWTPGGGPIAYYLTLGTTGAGSTNLYNSGTTTATTVTVNNIPTGWAKVYATLHSEIDGVWQATNYTYTEAGTAAPAVLTSPSPGALLGTSATFTWTPGNQVTAYIFDLGTTGSSSSDLYSSGSTTATSASVSGIPTNGVTLYATLYSKINGVWQISHYTYTETGTPVAAILISPAPGSVLSGSTVTFTWTPGSGPTAYYLDLGTTGTGSSNLYNSGTTTATSVTVNSIPTAGATVYATLHSEINGVWQTTGYTYTEQ